MAKYKPTTEQRALLEALRAEQMKEKSVKEFTKKFLPFGDAKWGTIMKALDESSESSYFDMISDRERQFEELEELLERIKLRRAISACDDDSLKLNRLSTFVGINHAVTACLDERGPERLVKYLAPTGGGKTMLGRFLAEQHTNVRIVECREAWRRSYFTFLSDICAAVKVPIAGESRPSAIEDALVLAMLDRTVVLVIDEAEFFGRESLNGLKLLLNKTRIVPVICAISEAHDKWNRYYPMEADQISRRTHSVVQLTQISQKDCALFFSENQFADANAETAHIATKASEFGHYSLIRRVARKLNGVRRAERSDVDTAIKSARVAMRREQT
jgi:hypothetical protein